MFEEQLALAEARRLELFGDDRPSHRRAIRRRHRKRHIERRRHIINLDGYTPNVGYIRKVLIEGRWVEASHIIYPSRSTSQRYLKRYCNHRVRHTDDLPVKGNHYRKIAEYWWALY